MTRREEREAVFELLYALQFRGDESAETVFATECAERNIPLDGYVKNVFFGTLENKEEIDGFIAKYSKGWKTERISKVSRSVLRLCIYEMLYETKIPTNVSLNEAIELCKKFDDEKARPFVNGVLHSVKLEAEARRSDVFPKPEG